MLRLSIAGLLLATAAPWCAAAAIDLGRARDYNAVFFGDLRAHSDIEGRVAVRGNVDLNSVSIGYRNPSVAGPHGSLAPSLLVGGDVRLGGGAIYNGPTDPSTDHNAGLGPDQAPWLSTGVSPGHAEHGGRNLGSAAYLDVRPGNRVDIASTFDAMQFQLRALSTQLGALSGTGEATSQGWDMRLAGSTARDGFHVFNVDANHLKSFTLGSTVGADEWVLVNLMAAGRIEFGWDYVGSGLSEIADRLVFNVLGADEVVLRSGYGLLLAPGASIVESSSGHWEGQVFARDMLSTIEIGYEPLRQAPPALEEGSTVSLPGTLPLLMVAALSAGWVGRRKRAGTSYKS